MKTYTFINKLNGAILTTSADDFSDAENQLSKVVKEPFHWKIENEDGEITPLSVKNG